MERENPSPSKHHALFPALEWEQRTQARAIRETPSLIKRIRRDEHDFMHEQVPLVPLLGYNTLLALPKNFHPTGQTVQDIEELCIAIERTIMPKRFHQIEKDLAGLAINSLLLQRDILQELGYD